MSGAGARWLAAIGAALLLTACTTTIDGAVPTRARTADSDTGATVGSAAASPPTSAAVPSSIAPPGSGDADSTGQSPALPWPQPSDAALPHGQALQAAVQRIAAVAASAGMRGVTAAVVTPQGSWAGAVGVDGDGGPLVPEAMMGIAEVTNTVTAAEVLLLAQDGRIDLDAPLSIYLNHPLLGRRQPTVRQVLSHTSGIPTCATQDLMTALRADPTRSWTAGQVLGYAPTVPECGPTDPLSMSDYLLLGLLIEKITGAATGIAADAAALARWGYRLYGGQVLSPAATTALSTPVTDGYGLGTSIIGDGGQQALPDYRLGGIGAIGHTGLVVPGYQSFLLAVPHDHLSVAVLAVPHDHLSVAVLAVAPSQVGAIENPIIIADILDALHT